MTKNKTCLLGILLLLCTLAQANAPDTNIVKKKYFTQRLSGSAITLDGIPSEAAWDAVPWGGDFIQNAPNEGSAPSQPTSFKILYDNKFLYIAYRCTDSSPDSIVKRMGRRDVFPGDWVEVNIDSYHDQRSGFSFTLSVSGVRSDEFISNNTNWDANWNPIWFAKTHVDKQGWTAEVKIPLSQLRYGNEKEKVWGIQFTRRLFRKEERSNWQYIPQNLGVWVSGFGELHGLNDIPFHRQVEIAPYVTAQVDKYKKDPGNPFADGADAKLTAGLDGKVAVTNDLIMDFTINPDFGQVEADPSQVRIDGFQSFLAEKRPFFIESRNIFEYQLTGSIAGGDYDADLLFYSRRIGSSPHGFPNTAAGEFVKYPQSTTILGAAKFSGKTKKGWSIGFLESITEREKATVEDVSGKRRKELVEPLTSYFVGRLQKDINGGNTIFGGIFTAVNREHGLDDRLHRGAYTGGLDFLHYWRNRTWYVRGNFVMSSVSGTKEAILNTQTSFEHLFQRTGAKEISVDSTRTSLVGTGGTFRFGKSAGRPGKMGQIFRFETGVTLRSPQLELNDIGFMLTANEINYFGWAGIRYQQPFSIFRNAGINYNHWLRWDYSGQLLYSQFNTNANAQFKNNWQANTSVTWNPYDVSNTSLRGAGSLRRPDGIGWNLNVNTDSRKKIAGNVSFFKWWGFNNTMRVISAGAGVTLVPINPLSISLNVNYDRNWRRQDQFVSNVSYNNGTRTIVAEVKQKTLRFTGRINYNITPDLTVQYYGQPFITRPLYAHFAYVKDGLNKVYNDRFQPFTPSQISFSNGTYSIDEDLDGNTDYSFSKPDFNFVQFRSNLIMRWEYKPGSEFYLVWSQNNTADAFDDLETPVMTSLSNNAFSGGNARNIFLLKFTYRFLK